MCVLLRCLLLVQYNALLGFVNGRLQFEGTMWRALDPVRDVGLRTVAGDADGGGEFLVLAHLQQLDVGRSKRHGCLCVRCE